MCTIFFQKSIKHILVPYKAVHFAVPVNILIIDVNLVPTRNHGWVLLYELWSKFTSAGHRREEEIENETKVYLKFMLSSLLWNLCVGKLGYFFVKLTRDYFNVMVFFFFFSSLGQFLFYFIFSRFATNCCILLPDHFCLQKNKKSALCLLLNAIGRPIVVAVW